MTATSDDEICTARIEMIDSDPLIWREVEVPTSNTLWDLHDIVQSVMNWQDYHLWEFTIGKQRFGPPSDENFGMEPVTDAAMAHLRDVLNPRRTTIRYLYDFGDNWEHRLIVSRIRPGEPDVAYPRLAGGERNAPPEDCGGIYGFYDKLAIAADRKAREHHEIKRWLGQYDPNRFEERRIKIALGRIAKAGQVLKKGKSTTASRRR